MLRNKKFILSFIVIVFLAITIFLALRNDNTTIVNSSPQKSIVLGLPMQPTSSLAIIAMDQGFFKDAGLMVEFKPFPSGKRALKEGLLVNEVDTIITADIPIMLESFKSHDLKILAAIASTNDLNRIVARRDRNISTPADLKKKWIATQQSSAVHYFLHLFLHKHLISKEEIRASFMKAEQLVPAIVNGTIDAFSMREPFISQAIQQLGDNAIVFSAPGIYPQSELFATKQQFIHKNPTIIHNLLKALLMAENFVKTYPKKAQDTVAKRLNITQADIASLWSALNLQVSLEQSLVLLLESQARWAIREGLVKAETIPDFMTYLHLDTLKKLKYESVTVVP